MFKYPLYDGKVCIINNVQEEFKITQENICHVVKSEKKTNKRNDIRIRIIVSTIQEPKIQGKEIQC